MSHRNPPVIAALGHVYAIAGRPNEAYKILDELQSESQTGYVSSFYVALVYAGLKDESRTMELLEKAYADRSNSMVFANVDPRLDSLRSNQSFRHLLDRMNFVD
ncbi:hypothetical protein [Tunturiibacter gelidiferens]|uniref:hypothetical protein n=1 Tax=Tunturiibacter gelidiferens TaxID=3069689 RepID=UPI003D9B1A25